MWVMAIVTIVLIGYSVYNFKNAVFLVSSVFVLQMHLSDGIVNTRLFYVVSFFQIIYYLFNYSHGTSQQKYPLWLSIPCIFTAIGYFLSSYYGVKKAYADVILSSICLFGYPAVLYGMIKTKEDLNEFIKFIYVFFVIVGLYAIIEEIARYNVYSNFIERIGAGKGYFGGLGDKSRYGLRRCNSLFAYCSTLGFTASITFFVVLYLKVMKISIHKKLENALLVLMPLCVLLSGTRSQFAVFGMCLFPFILWSRTYKSNTVKALIILVFVLLVSFSGYFGQIVESMLFSDSVGGSSTEMREGQLEICLMFFKMSPIWGFGKDYLNNEVIPYYPALYGAESIWFRLMVDYGLVGCLTFICSILGCIFYTVKYDRRFLFIPLAYLLGKTVSIVVGIEITYLFIICVLLCKVKYFYGKESSFNHEHIKLQKLLRLWSMRHGLQ